MAKRKTTPLSELLDNAQRDPIITSWERAFVASIRTQVEVRRQPWLSEEQSRVLGRLALKIGMELPASVQELVDNQERRDVLAIAIAARGDPRLSAWEEGFLVSMTAAARLCRPLSAKQRAVLEQIAAKVGETMPDDDLIAMEADEAEMDA
jgi:hypothetical protein